MNDLLAASLRRPSAQRGFTLIELIVFIVVISVGIVGILSVMNVTVKSSADPMVRKQAAALADAILEEIMLKSYADPDGVDGETARADMDDVDDFDGKDETLFTDLPAALSDYSVDIDVDPPAAVGGVTMKKVGVTVSRGSESILMVGYRANY